MEVSDARKLKAGLRDPQADEACRVSLLDVSILKEMLGKTSDDRLAERSRKLDSPRQRLFAAPRLRARRPACEDLPLCVGANFRCGVACDAAGAGVTAPAVRLPSPGTHESGTHRIVDRGTTHPHRVSQSNILREATNISHGARQMAVRAPSNTTRVERLSSASASRHRNLQTKGVPTTPCIRLIRVDKVCERLTEAGIELLVGSVGDSFDNALAETINGLHKAEIIHGRGPSRSLEVATMELVD